MGVLVITQKRRKGFADDKDKEIPPFGGHAAPDRDRQAISARAPL
jgi:hypothetical protein